MINFDVPGRFGGIQFTANIDCNSSAPLSTKLGLAVGFAFKNKISLFDANLRNADLRNADLRNADLSDVYLRNANLSNADLRNADLRNANLFNANLSNADLSDANLSNANLRNADLRNADLRGSIIKLDVNLIGDSPIFMMTPIGSELGTMIAFNTNSGIYIRRGCFFDTLDEFVCAVEKTHGDNNYGVIYRSAIAMIKTLWSKK